MDLYIFNLINGLAGKSAWLDKLGIFFAYYFEYILVAVLLFLLIFRFKKDVKMVLIAFVCAVVSRFVITSSIRHFWFRPRPFLTEKVNLLVNYDGKEASFPSGHASFFFALSTVLFLYNRKLGILFYLFTILITLSRIFIGIHWPSDVLAGALIGIFIGWLGFKIINKKYEKFE